MLFLLSLVKTLNTSSLLIIHLLVNILNFKVIIINMESLVAGVVAGLRHKLAPAAAIRPGARAPPACFPCLSLCLHGCNCNGSNRRVTGSSNYHNAATSSHCQNEIQKIIKCFVFVLIYIKLGVWCVFYMFWSESGFDSI